MNLEDFLAVAAIGAGLVVVLYLLAEILCICLKGADE